MVELSFERLYLAKNCNNIKDIFVNKCPLVQHQLDGIRFLYRAMKKKIPAVILNDPSGSGKRVQTALFLSAVLPTLDKPVLIMCREGKEQRWMRYFQQWTEVSDDVAIELSNPFIKKKVIISAVYCASEFARREWSVLVVDDDLISRDLLKSSLKADLRIWITSSDVKEDLAKFSTFYSWVYPKRNKFIADRFIANKNDLKDVLLKSVMLDAFLEDTVLKRDIGVTPFTKTQISIPNTEPKPTKKNKDATGTKIKRSKRKSNDNNTTIETEQSKVAKTNNSMNKIEQNTEVFEIGEFADEKQTEVANLHKDIFNNVENIESQCDDDNFIPTSTKSKRSKFLWDSEDSYEEVEKTDMQIDENKDQKDSDQNESDESKVLRWDSETDTEKDHKESQADSNGGQKCITLKSPTITDKMIYVDDEELENSGTRLVDVNEIEVSNINDSENEINNIIQSEDIFLTNPNEMNVKEIIYETQDKEEPASTDNSKENGADITQNKTNKTDNANLSSFDLKMRELEELTLKKYKGSFLDRIF